jgi:hypothetical protein
LFEILLNFRGRASITWADKINVPFQPEWLARFTRSKTPMISLPTFTDCPASTDTSSAVELSMTLEPVLRLDEISRERAAFLRAELARQPAIRPDVVARARTLAADPNYPPVAVLRKVAEQILGSPDLSEDRRSH